jgi:hypothetical protein
MFHVGVLLHHGCVLIKFLFGPDNHLMHNRACIFDFEADRFALFNRELIWREAHVVGHLDGNDSVNFLGVTSDSPSLLLGGHYHCAVSAMSPGVMLIVAMGVSGSDQATDHGS